MWLKQNILTCLPMLLHQKIKQFKHIQRIVWIFLKLLSISYLGCLHFASKHCLSLVLKHVLLFSTSCVLGMLCFFFFFFCTCLFTVLQLSFDISRALRNKIFLKKKTDDEKVTNNESGLCFCFFLS